MEHFKTQIMEVVQVANDYRKGEIDFDEAAYAICYLTDWELEEAQQLISNTDSQNVSELKEMQHKKPSGGMEQ